MGHSKHHSPRISLTTNLCTKPFTTLLSNLPRRHPLPSPPLALAQRSQLFLSPSPSLMGEQWHLPQAQALDTHTLSPGGSQEPAPAAHPARHLPLHRGGRPPFCDSKHQQLAAPGHLVQCHTQPVQRKTKQAPSLLSCPSQPLQMSRCRPNLRLACDNACNRSWVPRTL